ncbi:unnamed protein product [Arctia plantaginis]|uniref:Uncharacterized protein n=1 Tax=Arctia plantaginis TaxID=874455 RepID=A0A8S1BE56_ARCPL|nr:unnamed protein product [Arctia plantaginis]
MSFENKVVLITGSGSGMGEAAALLFAEKGANVIILDINEESANKTGEKCKQFGHKVLVIKTDLSKDDEAKNAIEQTISVFGKLDVLVNNAGIARQENLLSGNIMQTCDEVLNTNLRSVILMTSLATPYLIKTKGCIVNTSSIFSKVTSLGAHYPVYAVSKAGVDCFTRVSALELAPSGVRVNAVNPGPVRTNIIKNSNLDGTYDDFGAKTALKRCSEPQEVAELIVFLASDKAKSITGCTYGIDNGAQLV